MHVPFRIHYRNNLIDKKDSYPIPRPPSWDDRNCSYGHQLYLSDGSYFPCTDDTQCIYMLLENAMVTITNGISQMTEDLFFYHQIILTFY
jgi:hypothetical protein